MVPSVNSEQQLRRPRDDASFDKDDGAALEQQMKERRSKFFVLSFSLQTSRHDIAF